MFPDRRDVLALLATTGIGSKVFRQTLAALAQPSSPAAEISAEVIQQAERIAGISLSEEHRREVAAQLNRWRRGAEAARHAPLANHVAPAIRFDPTPPQPTLATGRGSVSASAPPVDRPADDDLAFLSVSQLGVLLRRKAISSVELTRIYLDRLKKYDPALKCVITLTEELARKQARRADDELASGKDRGPLHGIPWGAKDLIAISGYKTTWGAAEYQDQQLDTTATVASRLEHAGAVLVAKLSLGALAYNDVWFGGRTNNPWNIREGSSGSSAGSACATVAGLVGFSLGSETLGSIIGPSTRCGATGLRPTFGRVSRHGCMTLSWTMDKVGPIGRCVEDCALVLGAIHGADGQDATAVDRPFDWPCPKPLNAIRVGYIGDDPNRPELEVLRSLGVTLLPITLPRQYVGWIVNTILNAEAGAAFDELIRAGNLDRIGALWPTPFRASHFVTAVDYLRAQRLRRLLMQEMAEVMEKVDVYVGGNDLAITNLTGHPTVCLPNGFVSRGGFEVPTSITFTGRLFGESELLAVAQAYQEATGHHRKRPPQNTWK